MGRLAVVAVGGNSITKAGQSGTIPEQFANSRETSRHIAGMMARGYDVVVTHGNGPQVGNILLRAEMACSVLPMLPLDTCGADSQGAIGYMIQQVLANELRALGQDRCVATVVTQIVVDANDPAFLKPSKPIGPFYTSDEAHRKESEQGWNIVEDANRGWRRVVPSPMPKRIVEAERDQGAPRLRLHRDRRGRRRHSGRSRRTANSEGSRRSSTRTTLSRLLANFIGASLFVMSTDVEQVALNFGTPEEKRSVEHDGR